MACRGRAGRGGWAARHQRLRRAACNSCNNQLACNRPRHQQSTPRHSPQQRCAWAGAWGGGGKKWQWRMRRGVSGGGAREAAGHGAGPPRPGAGALDAARERTRVRRDIWGGGARGRGREASAAGNKQVTAGKGAQRPAISSITQWKVRKRMRVVDKACGRRGAGVLDSLGPGARQLGRRRAGGGREGGPLGALAQWPGAHEGPKGSKSIRSLADEGTGKDRGALGW